jgi:hypothetical protein
MSIRFQHRRLPKTSAAAAHATASHHVARVPREHWTHRLTTIKAMGLNAVCACLCDGPGAAGEMG